MPHRDWLFRITDILAATSTVETYVKGMSYEDFVADRKTVDAVIRNFIIIGEAASHVPEEISQNHPEVRRGSQHQSQQQRHDGKPFHKP